MKNTSAKHLLQILHASYKGNHPDIYLYKWTEYKDKSHKGRETLATMYTIPNGEIVNVAARFLPHCLQ